MDKSMERMDSINKRMEILRSGGSLECPFCKKGHIVMVNPSVFTCDKCGKGIVARVTLKHN